MLCNISRNSLIIQDENTKENHNHVVSLYKIKPRLNLVHPSNISIRTRSIREQRMISPPRLAKTKQEEYFLVSSFVRLLAYARAMILCLCLGRY